MCYLCELPNPGETYEEQEARFAAPQPTIEPTYWTARCSCGWEVIDLPGKVAAFDAGVDHRAVVHGVTG